MGRRTGSEALGRLHSPLLLPGPCFFLSCPIGIEDFRTWFIDLWNNSIIPYLQEGAKDGIKVSPPWTLLNRGQAGPPHTVETESDTRPLRFLGSPPNRPGEALCRPCCFPAYGQRPANG